MKMTDVKTLWIVLASLVLTTVALAQDPSGQFPGVYVLEGSVEPRTAEDLDALRIKCLLAPGVMHEGGFGVGYFLDRDLFQSTGTISYIKGQEYRCRYSAATRKETCESKELSDGKSLAYYRSNVYEVFTRELQRGHSLLTPEDVAAWNSKGIVNPETRFAYRRCDCLKVEDIEARASSLANTLSSDETGYRLFWWNRDITDEELEAARPLLQTFNTCKPAVS
jgi:hypothetical protein